MTKTKQAKGIAQRGVATRPEGDPLSPTIAAEVLESLRRCQIKEKAETLAAELGVSVQHFYKHYMARPGRFPVDGLFVLAEHDPDPEFIPRVCAHLFAAVSAKAMRRQAAGQSTLILQQASLGWGKP